MKENGKFYKDDVEVTPTAADAEQGVYERQTETIHHEADAGQDKITRYVLDKVYPNGGRDFHEEVVQEGRPPKPEYDETIVYYVYREYTAEEKAERAKAAEIDAINAELDATKDKVIAHIEGLISDEEYAVIAARRTELRARLAALTA